jgi:hypothetical protein
MPASDSLIAPHQRRWARNTAYAATVETFSGFYQNSGQQERVRIISRNTTLFRAIAGGARGAISSGDAASQDARRRQRGIVTVD